MVSSAPPHASIVSHGFHSRVKALADARSAAADAPALNVAVRRVQKGTRRGDRGRKEVSHMSKYKVTKVFVVEAASKEAAVAKVSAEPGELLEFVSVIEQPGGKSGWGNALKTQLTGT